MSDRLSTIHIDTGREMRGGQRQVLFLSRGLAELGHRVLVVTPAGAPLAGALREFDAVETLELPLRGELPLRATRATKLSSSATRVQ